MEMPEGWKRFYRVGQKEMNLTGSKFSLEFINGLNLMKEMAETLHNIQAESVEELTDPELDGIFVTSYIRNMLKKFKEWK